MNTKDDEYKKLTEEWQTKSQTFLKERQEEQQKIMAKRQAAMQRAQKDQQEASSQINTQVINPLEQQAQLGEAVGANVDSLLM